ncbi:hypothetical protein TrCOL_g13527 [Triparma columacea]|uniref:Uncharacterized protein n=1 Tax=Triparma columacea TaxID=722753 RepID=A0A9W7LBJ0_9STRA|nr:hypothetical protein TrCOL_g13527 [Triparma columacea]
MPSELQTLHYSPEQAPKARKLSIPSFNLLKKSPKIYLDASEGEDGLGVDDVEATYAPDGRLSDNLPVGHCKVAFVPSSNPPEVQLGLIIQVSDKEQVVLNVDKSPRAVLSESGLFSSEILCVPAYCKLQNETKGMVFPSFNPVTSLSFDASSQTFYYQTAYDTGPLMVRTTSESDVRKIIPAYFSGLMSNVLAMDSHSEASTKLRTLQNDLAERGVPVDAAGIAKSLADAHTPLVNFDEKAMPTMQIPSWLEEYESIVYRSISPTLTTDISSRSPLVSFRKLPMSIPTNGEKQPPLSNAIPLLAIVADKQKGDLEEAGGDIETTQNLTTAPSIPQLNLLNAFTFQKEAMQEDGGAGGRRL